tara:strand:- start:153 stop:638 length:486 start_codon:yes stop_codon:yes gene_type:complete
MREKMMAWMLDCDVLPVKGRLLEQCFDRLMYRIGGENVTGDSWHRDEAKNAKPNDDIFGGWVNLNDYSHYFSCVPYSHREAGKQNSGFAKITDSAEKLGLEKQKVIVEIPSGCCLVFYERLVHEVRKSAFPMGNTMIRMFLGWRVTDDEFPICGPEKTSTW